MGLFKIRVFHMYRKLNKKGAQVQRKNIALIAIGLILFATIFLYFSITKLPKEKEYVIIPDFAQDIGLKISLHNATNKDVFHKEITIIKDIISHSSVMKTHTIHNDNLTPVSHKDSFKQFPLPKGLQGWVPSFKDPITKRQKAVREAMKHAWNAYESQAWGYDELRPLSRGGANWFNVGLTIVDSLDTLLIMGLNQEYRNASQWVIEQLDFSANDHYVNLFEVTIRVLGGLLSAYHLSGHRDVGLLEKALDLCERLLAAFASPSGIPYSDVNLKTRHAKSVGLMESSTSEVTTLQLEFTDLSRSTNISTYEKLVAGVSAHIHGLPKMQGLVPIFISPRDGKFKYSTKISLGARGDSYYEYLLKAAIQTGGSEEQLISDYVTAVTGIIDQLIGQVTVPRRDGTGPQEYTYVAEYYEGLKDLKMDHLVCFLPGTLAYGLMHGIGGKAPSSLSQMERFNLEESHKALAINLTSTCYEMYAATETGLSPEIVHFDDRPGAVKRGPFYIKHADTHNLLRPETVESLFYMYKLTKDKKYQEWGWNIFVAFENYTKILSGGYSSIDNVLTPISVGYRDRMESYFLAETLKYLYLLFQSDESGGDLIPLDRFVFNSEGHPLPLQTRDA